MHSQLDRAIANATGIAAAIFYGCRVETTLLVLVFCLFRQPDSSSFKRLGLGPNGSCSFVSTLLGQREMWQIFSKKREGSALLNVLHHPLRRQVTFIFIFYGQIVIFSTMLQVNRLESAAPSIFFKKPHCYR